MPELPLVSSERPAGRLPCFQESSRQRYAVAITTYKKPPINLDLTSPNLLGVFILFLDIYGAVFLFINSPLFALKIAFMSLVSWLTSLRNVLAGHVPLVLFVAFQARS